MARDYNYFFYAGADNKRVAFGGNNAIKSRSSLNSSMFSKQDSGEQITQFNLKNVANAGLAFNTLQKGNEIYGSYTNNRLGQRRFNVGMTKAKYGLGFLLNPIAGGIYTGSDLGYRSIMYGIKVGKKNRQAEYFRNLSGNNANSGRIYRGAHL